MQTHCDVLIIGAGGAGLRAAIEASDMGSAVILMGKTLLGKAHTVMAEGGINAALGNVDPRDNWTVHFSDTMKEGQMINDWRMVETITREAPEIIKMLESYGVKVEQSLVMDPQNEPFPIPVDRNVGGVQVREHTRRVTQVFGRRLGEAVIARVRAHTAEMRMPARPYLVIQDEDREVLRGFVRRRIEGQG